MQNKKCNIYITSFPQSVERESRKNKDGFPDNYCVTKSETVLSVIPGLSRNLAVPNSCIQIRFRYKTGMTTLTSYASWEMTDIQSISTGTNQW